MKRFFCFVFCLVLGFVVANLIFLWALPKIDWNFEKAQEAFNFKNESFEVLVLGNSTALDGINTEMLSRFFGPTYNFSIGGASLETNYIQLSKYLRENHKPSKVLVFLSSCHLNYNKEQEVNPIIDHYYTESNRFLSLADIPLFKFRWLFIEDFKLLLSEEHRNAKIVNGQLRLAKTVPDDTMADEVSVLKCLTVDTYSSRGYHFLDMISELCSTNKIEMIAFEMPCWQKYQNNCKDLVVEYGEERQIYNLNRADMCASVLSPQGDWLSENHLNFSGSNKLTTYVIGILKSDVLVGSHNENKRSALHATY
jgi:hypothetical protein